MGTKAENRAAAIQSFKEEFRGRWRPMPEITAALTLTLVGDMLDSLERIAVALETRATVAPMGKGTIIGELAKFEPAIPPEAVERIVKALETLASPPATTGQRIF